MKKHVLTKNVIGTVTGTALLLTFAGTAQAETAKTPASGQTVKPPVITTSAPAKKELFTPPDLDSIPDNDFGKTVRLGANIFANPSRYASQYVGNQLRCSSCHLDNGRKAFAAPMWAAWVSYPAFRAKNGHVNTFAERLQGCFRFSMNGKKPPADDKVLVALESYAYWLASGAKVDSKLPGRSYAKLDKPAVAPSFERGKQVYEQNCALCHAADGQGQHDSAGNMVFPALWGNNSFNWGAGMGNYDKAAAFIRQNMPLSKEKMLTEQQAWDVAYFIDSHERPQDPRFTGSVEETREKYHNEKYSMYGKTINNHQLGSNSVAPGGTLNKAAK